MAAAANYSPRKSSTGDASASIHSPGRRSRGGSSSPWIQPSVRAEPDTIASPTPSSPMAAQASSCYSDDHVADVAEAEGGGGDNAARKPAWNKPSNGAAAEVGPVMGAESWPALSESTRASPKAASLSSSDSPKPLPDGSLTLPQGAGVASPSSHKQVMMNNTNPSLAPNHVVPTRQKSMKRGGGGGGSFNGNNTANGGPSQQPAPSLGPAVDMPPNNSPREHTHKETGQRGGGGAQHSRTGNDHPHHRESFRKGNGGSHPRGDGSHHHNSGGRGNQDRGNHEWNSQRSFSGRDSHIQPRGVVPSPRGYRPPAHASTPFIHPPPVAIRPYPLVYPDVPPPVILYAAPPPESFRGVPMIAPMSPHGMFYTGPDPQLIARIVQQIDYYFSNDNLIKDTYLRRNMDEQGWVPIRLIASFKKMSNLTENVQLILDAVRASVVVEVQDDKVRRREDWPRWILPVQSPNVSSPQSQGSSSSIQNMIVANAQNLSLEEKPVYQSQTSFGSSSLSGDFGQSPSAGQTDVQAQADQTVFARSPSE